MDETVTRHALCGLLLLAVGAEAAAALPDPTRPPANLMSGASVAAAPTPSAPQLQSVLIARQAGGRHVAVIDGHTLRLGETYKGATLASVTPTQVVLVQGKQRQVLRLYPVQLPRQLPAQR